MNDTVKIFLIVMAIMIPLSVPIGMFAQFLADVITSEWHIGMKFKEASGDTHDITIINMNKTNLKPNGEYDCGERSSDSAVEQARIICENQHYDITGKNKTIINGYKTYCCPSPWVPDNNTKLGVLGPAGNDNMPSWNGSANIDNFTTPTGPNGTTGFPSYENGTAVNTTLYNNWCSERSTIYLIEHGCDINDFIGSTTSVYTESTKVNDTKVEHPCLEFADGKHALLTATCEGMGDTLEWLFSVGYEVYHMSDKEMILVRTHYPTNSSEIIHGEIGPAP